jgi:hypothetical protein
MSNSSSNSIRRFVADRRKRLGDWRVRRPFLGGVLILLGNAFMWLVTLGYAPSVLLIGSQTAFIGLVVSSFVFLTGVFALTKPEYSTIIGYVGIPLSFISLMGTLGGLIIGMILGIIGSSLCIAWESDEIEESNPFNWGSDSDSDSDSAESDDEDISGLVNKWR